MKTRLTKTVVADKSVEETVYKIFTENEWRQFKESGQFSGSADDLRDGFIHLSAGRQVAGVIARFFAGKRPLYVAAFSDPELLARVTWESSDSGEIYPHLYKSKLFMIEVSDLNILQ